MQEVDPLYIQALGAVLEEKNPSISTIQRKCSVGYAYARKIAKWMEGNGYIASMEDKTREITVLMSEERFETLYGKRKTSEKKRQVSADDIENYGRKALEALADKETVSLSFLRSALHVDYSTAGLILEWLEERKYVSAFAGAKPRKVLIEKE